MNVGITWLTSVLADGSWVDVEDNLIKTVSSTSGIRGRCGDTPTGGTHLHDAREMRSSLKHVAIMYRSGMPALVFTSDIMM